MTDSAFLIVLGLGLFIAVLILSIMVVNLDTDLYITRLDRDAMKHSSEYYRALVRSSRSEVDRVRSAQCRCDCHRSCCDSCKKTQVTEDPRASRS